MEKIDPQYDATNIQVLGGIEAVRKRPAMYIGDTSVSGLHHLVYEVMDNSIDEAMAGFCNEILVAINADNSVTVADNGRGIPVDIHKTENKPALEVVMTVLHAGGKFDRKVYQVSGGLHGVGVSVVNALSEWLEVEVKKGGKVYHQRYEKGVAVTPLKVIGDTKTSGTKVTFKPDDKIFETVEFDDNVLSGRLKELAFLNAGIKILFTDERKSVRENYEFSGGIISFVNSLNKNKKVLFDQPFYFKKTEEDVEVEIAIQYNEGFSETVLSFANNVNTKEGGTHISGFRGGLTRAINEYGKNNGFLGDKPLAGEDVREGLVSVVSVKLGEPQFEGQTKTKLGNSRIRFLVEGLTSEQIVTFLEENPSPAREIINKCLMTSRAREAARKARELTRKKLSETGALPGKLADCSTKEPDKREIFIVEGDSAGGSAKQGRDRIFQAILPLKGKIINSEKAPLDKVLNNNEVKMIISAIGGGVGEDFNAEKIRYHKVIIMTDADVDGAHIRTLLLTFFYRQMTDLIKRGNIYIAQPPLYKVKRGKREFYVDTERQMDETLIELAKDNLGLKIKKNGEFTDAAKSIVPLANLSNRLNELKTSLEMKGINFNDLLRYWNEKKSLPLYRIQYKEDLLFCEDDNELAEFLKQNNAQQIDLFAENKDYQLMEIYESRDIAKILKKLESYELTFLSSEDKKLCLTENPGQEEPLSILELYEKLKIIGKKGLNIQRYKGLGEMNPLQLWETTMNPETRRMKQVSLDDAVKAEEIFTILMGDAVEPRREFIQTFAREVKNLDI